MSDDKKGNAGGDTPSAETIRAINARIDKVESQQRQDEEEERSHNLSQLRVNRTIMVFTGLLFATSAISDYYLFRQTGIARDSADAAKSAAETARKTLEATNRPWVSFDISLASPLTFDAEGAHLSFGVLFKNTGGSTAVSVGFKMEMWRDPTPTVQNGILRERDRLCQEATQQANPALNKALFVGGQRLDKWIISYPAEGVAASVKQMGLFSVDIITCAEYRSPVSDRFFETSSVLWLGRERYMDHGRPSFAIVPPDPIPANLLVLSQDPSLGLSAN